MVYNIQSSVLEFKFVMLMFQYALKFLLTMLLATLCTLTLLIILPQHFSNFLHTF